MLKVYRFLDGFSIVARDEVEFAVKLRKSSWFPTNNLEDYLAEFAKRVYILYGINIRSDSGRNFVSDLLNHKLLYIQELN